jgi:hypothetical protein
MNEEGYRTSLNDGWTRAKGWRERPSAVRFSTKAGLRAHVALPSRGP